MLQFHCDLGNKFRVGGVIQGVVFQSKFGEVGIHISFKMDPVVEKLGFAVKLLWRVDIVHNAGVGKGVNHFSLHQNINRVEKMQKCIAGIAVFPFQFKARRFYPGVADVRDLKHIRHPFCTIYI